MLRPDWNFCWTGSEGRGGLIVIFASPPSSTLLLPFPGLAPSTSVARACSFLPHGPLAGITRRNCERVSFSSVDRGGGARSRQREQGSGGKKKSFHPGELLPLVTIPRFTLDRTKVPAVLQTERSLYRVAAVPQISAIAPSVLGKEALFPEPRPARIAPSNAATVQLARLYRETPC